jgi:hypothetical protein
MLVPDLQDANKNYFFCPISLCHFGTDPDPQIHASLWLIDPDLNPGLDPDSAIFVIDQQKTNFL